jgi:hypothetical protein
MIAVQQKLPNGGTQTTYLNPDAIERMIPFEGGSMVNGMGGTQTMTVETPEQINALAKGDKE